MRDGTRLQGLAGLASQLRAALSRASLSGGDDSSLLFWRFPVLSWAKGSVKVHKRDVAPLPLLSLPFSRHLNPPLVIFPTHQPIRAPCASGRSDPIGCAGVSGRSELCSFHTVSFLDSFQQHPHADSRRRKVRGGEGKGGNK